MPIISPIELNDLRARRNKVEIAHTCRAARRCRERHVTKRCRKKKDILSDCHEQLHLKVTGPDASATSHYEVYLGRVNMLAGLRLGLGLEAPMPSLHMMAEAGVIVKAPFQHCHSNYFPVPVPPGVAATEPVLLVDKLGEPLRLGVTSKEATGSPRGGLVCLVAVAYGRDGSLLEEVSPGVSDAFEVVTAGKTGAPCEERDKLKALRGIGEELAKHLPNLDTALIERGWAAEEVGFVVREGLRGRTGVATVGEFWDFCQWLNNHDDPTLKDRLVKSLKAHAGWHTAEAHARDSLGGAEQPPLQQQQQQQQPDLNSSLHFSGTASTTLPLHSESSDPPEYSSSPQPRQLPPSTPPSPPFSSTREPSRSSSSLAAPPKPPQDVLSGPTHSEGPTRSEGCSIDLDSSPTWSSPRLPTSSGTIPTIATVATVPTAPTIATIATTQPPALGRLAAPDTLQQFQTEQSWCTQQAPPTPEDPTADPSQQGRQGNSPASRQVAELTDQEYGALAKQYIQYAQTTRSTQQQQQLQQLQQRRQQQQPQQLTHAPRPPRLSFPCASHPTWLHPPLSLPPPSSTPRFQPLLLLQKPPPTNQHGPPCLVPHGTSPQLPQQPTPPPKRKAPPPLQLLPSARLRMRHTTLLHHRLSPPPTTPPPPASSPLYSLPLLGFSNRAPPRIEHPPHQPPRTPPGSLKPHHPPLKRRPYGPPPVSILPLALLGGKGGRLPLHPTCSLQADAPTGDTRTIDTGAGRSYSFFADLSQALPGTEAGATALMASPPPPLATEAQDQLPGYGTGGECLEFDESMPPFLVDVADASDDTMAAAAMFADQPNDVWMAMEP